MRSKNHLHDNLQLHRTFCSQAKNDLEYIRNCLLKNKSLYEDNVINKLFKVIVSSNCYKSNNFADFINKDLNYGNVALLNEEDFIVEEGCFYLIIYDKKNMDIKDISLSIDKYKKEIDADRFSYIIVDSIQDGISIIKFGGKNEINY